MARNSQVSPRYVPVSMTACRRQSSFRFKNTSCRIRGPIERPAEPSLQLGISVVIQPPDASPTGLGRAFGREGLGDPSCISRDRTWAHVTGVIAFIAGTVGRDNLDGHGDLPSLAIGSFGESNLVVVGPLLGDARVYWRDVALNDLPVETAFSSLITLTWVQCRLISATRSLALLLWRLVSVNKPKRMSDRHNSRNRASSPSSLSGLKNESPHT